MAKNKERILPGFKPVLELLQQEPERITKVLARHDSRHAGEIQALCRKNGVPLELVRLASLDELCGEADERHVAHQGLVAILSRASFLDIQTLLANAPHEPLPLILALDQIRDPGNLGTICRTAYALGCAGLILPKHNSASLGPAAMRASAGALEKMPCSIVTNLARTLDMADELDFHIYGASGALPPAKDTQAGKFINAFEHEWQFPMILVLGSEGQGIRAGVAKRCARTVSIPLARQFDSLNVAQAGAIILGLCSASRKQA